MHFRSYFLPPMHQNTTTKNYFTTKLTHNQEVFLVSMLKFHIANFRHIENKMLFKNKLVYLGNFFLIYQVVNKNALFNIMYFI